MTTSILRTIPARIRAKIWAPSMPPITCPSIHGAAKIGIKAPRDIPVHRLEVYDTIREANVEATKVQDPDLSQLRLKKPGSSADNS